jgi:hypothetical protein
MSRLLPKQGDAPWVNAVVALHGWLLSLYPAEFRREYGTELRQALRDRCRDAVLEQRPVAGFLIGELLPDLCHSIWEEQTMAFYSSSSRRSWVLAGGLLFALLAVIFANSAGRWYWDHYNPQRVAYEKYEKVQAEEQRHLQPFIDRLTNSDQPAARATAAYLRVAGMESGPDGLSDEQQKTLRSAAQEINSLAQTNPDAFTLSILGRACQLDQNCDTTALTRRFVRLQPTNADAWQLAFGAAMKAKDAPGIRVAIAGLAGAQDADFNDGRLMHLLLQQAAAFAPSDQHLLRTLASRVGFHDWATVTAAYRLRSYCDPSAIADNGQWRADCGRIAETLARSNSVYASVSGTILQYRLSAEPERSGLLAEYRNRIWLRNKYLEMIGAVSLYNYGDVTLFDKYDADTLAAGERWQAAWSDAGNETQALHNWLAIQGLPTAAPADFKLSPTDMQRLSDRPVESFKIAL